MTGRIIRIAVDAMGGDNIPGVLVDGCAAALSSYGDVEIALVGDEKKVGESLDRVLDSGIKGKSGSTGFSLRDRLRVVHADEVIGMSESPVHAIRAKKNSSIVVANKLCRSGEVEAVISAGNTGAAMASSLLYMGRLTGVLRPAILALFPSQKRIVAILDVGANTDCKTETCYRRIFMHYVYCSSLQTQL